MSDWPETPHFLDSDKLEDGVGLALSGGGYRAMVFHLGGLIRLNELGWLPRLDRISSVSGGSIAAGALAKAWPDLAFDPVTGVAAEFDRHVVQPVYRLARTTIDWKATAWSLLPGIEAARRVADTYDEILFKGTTLTDLTRKPRFVFNATNMQTGSLWRIAPEYAADHRVGRIDNPPFRLADTVAASSAFPPILSPLTLDLAEYPGVEVRDHEGADLHRRPFTDKLVLTDGGVYDNLGLEPIWGRYRTLIVSNAGRNAVDLPMPGGRWARQLMRIISLIHMQPENLRERVLVSMARELRRKLAFWTIDTAISRFGVKGQPDFPADGFVAAAETPTRLKALSDENLRVLTHAGYLLCDGAMRCYLDAGAAAPARLPAMTSA